MGLDGAGGGEAGDGGESFLLVLALLGAEFGLGAVEPVVGGDSGGGEVIEELFADGDDGGIADVAGDVAGEGVPPDFDQWPLGVGSVEGGVGEPDASFAEGAKGEDFPFETFKEGGFGRVGFAVGEAGEGGPVLGYFFRCLSDAGHEFWFSKSEAVGGADEGVGGCAALLFHPLDFDSVGEFGGPGDASEIPDHDGADVFRLPVPKKALSREGDLDGLDVFVAVLE